ncbi:UDP-2,4-diacetamido-2,4,6-trideoxy-beta-L-altropyranose hydrolase [Paenibacillus hunanensis]|uniref:UDP-2,4-diacetamido-2,4, 6-trideoxy-beta-L-altropyranose hydrolase n=1 Tax=Paenibacillus hunanensis TaxID=539262 RepID=A0ABU1ITM5_9BACL|nr:UDP-2,4-diacetamido-2,4,6-trideoxy-beta-L-altropyranose hydrolase [Paenibacillus hunanensis]MDR6242605.1 UDP-2,4-diacetamido-2,4,6-trideoxy-beta-L-altropyranose hydrolase [Paenibacillus hunanensis]GGJ01319.1 UDP-2,4-diacetamido-2,4,6-trideoxy-beta-L-altropyranose hydrolase [Paenibacillus hunanensis]
MYNIAIRVDASVQIGIGHVMRCLTLAQMLKQSLDSHIIFVCAEGLPGKVNIAIREAGHDLILISALKSIKVDWNEDARQTIQQLCNYKIHWLIVDHYQLDYRWEQMLKQHVNHILVIDDLANRKHDCTALIDQNLHPAMNERYNKWVPMQCRLFLGPANLLLRSEFAKLRQHRQTVTKFQHILLNFGGSDPTHETKKWLKVLLDYPTIIKQVHLHVVAGPANTEKEVIQQLCMLFPKADYYDQADMAALLLGMDAAIGAGGITMWERCFMGVPSAVISVADNQLESVYEAERLKLIWNLGKSECIEEEKFIGWLKTIMNDLKLLRIYQHRCLNYMSSAQADIHPVVEYIKGEL